MIVRIRTIVRVRTWTGQIRTLVSFDLVDRLLARPFLFSPQWLQSRRPWVTLSPINGSHILITYRDWFPRGKTAANLSLQHRDSIHDLCALRYLTFPSF